jgi:hypothetical protein
MAWIDVHIMQDTITEDKNGRAKAKVVLYAEADDAFVECDAALSADDGTQAVPARRESYSAGRPRCRVIERLVERVNDRCPNQFIITVNYEDPTDGSDSATLLSLPADIKITGERLMEQYTKDAEGTPVLNSALDPFDQNPERQTNVRVYEFRKYVGASTLAALQAAENTNNAAAKTIKGRSYPTDTLWLTDVEADEIEDEDGVPTGVYDTHWAVKYNPNKWKDAPVDAGFRQRISGKPVAIKEYDAEEGKWIPVAKQYPLDGSGLALGGGPPTPAGFTADDLVYLEFWPYPQNAWAGVPLS